MNYNIPINLIHIHTIIANAGVHIIALIGRPPPIIRWLRKI